MPKKPSKTRQAKVDTICNYFADVDCGLSSLQRVRTTDAIEQRCRELRVSVTQLLSDVLNVIDPDYACEVPPGLLDRLPTDAEDAGDGRMYSGAA